MLASCDPTSVDATHGLGWERNSWPLDVFSPIWTIQPSMSIAEMICRRELSISPESPCILSALDDGKSRNKAYKVESDSGTFAFRVALPLAPHKIASEVANMRFVRKSTTIPVPAVIAFDSSNDNELSFAWILMEFMRGATAGSVWRRKPLDRKEKVIIQLAGFQHQLSQHSFQAIGGLHPGSSGLEDPAIGRLARMEAGEHQASGFVATPLGPFESSHEWVRQRVITTIQVTEQLRANAKDDEPLSLDHLGADEREEAIEEAQRLVGVAEQASTILNFLPACYSILPETTSLFHTDLHLGNILVDEDDRITAIIDWEFLNTVPAWKSHDFPMILSSIIRREDPAGYKYRAPDSEEEAACVYQFWEGISVCYWDDLAQYESTKLREVYLREVSSLAPGWSERYEKSKFHRLLEEQLTYLEQGMPCFQLVGWLEAYHGDGGVPHSEGLNWPTVREDTLCWSEKMDKYLEAEAARENQEAEHHTPLDSPADISMQEGGIDGELVDCIRERGGLGRAI